MRKQKIYLKQLCSISMLMRTGFCSRQYHCVINEIATGKYEEFTSRFVIDELNNAPEAK